MKDYFVKRKRFAKLIWEIISFYFIYIYIYIFHKKKIYKPSTKTLFFPEKNHYVDGWVHGTSTHT